MSFYVLQCKCGRWNAKEIRSMRSALHCKYCGKAHRMKSKRLFGMALNALGPFEDAMLAGDWVRRMNMRKLK